MKRTMIPDSATIERKGDVLHWTNSDFQIEVEEATAIKERIEEVIDNNNIEGILVDNEEAGGTWPNEVDDIWNELMSTIYEEGIDCATIAASATNAIHINRLSDKNGTDERIKAYKPSEKEEAKQFVGVRTADV